MKSVQIPNPSYVPQVKKMHFGIINLWLNKQTQTLSKITCELCVREKIISSRPRENKVHFSSRVEPGWFSVVAAAAFIIALYWGFMPALRATRAVSLALKSPEQMSHINN